MEIHHTQYISYLCRYCGGIIIWAISKKKCIVYKIDKYIYI